MSATGLFLFRLTQGLRSNVEEPIRYLLKPPRNNISFCCESLTNKSGGPKFVCRSHAFRQANELKWLPSPLSWQQSRAHARALTPLGLRRGLIGSLGRGTLRRRDHRLAKLTPYMALLEWKDFSTLMFNECRLGIPVHTLTENEGRVYQQRAGVWIERF